MIQIGLLLHIKLLSLSNEKVIERFSFIACELTNASNKQRQEHNNLDTIRRANSREPMSASRVSSL